MTIYRLDILLSQFGTSPLFHVYPYCLFWNNLTKLEAGGFPQCIFVSRNDSKFPPNIQDILFKCLASSEKEKSRVWVYAQFLQSCPTLCDHSLPGSSAHGILPAWILEWVAISFSRESSWPGDRTCISCIDRQVLYPRTTWEVQNNFTCWKKFSSFRNLNEYTWSSCVIIWKRKPFIKHLLCDRHCPRS